MRVHLAVLALIGLTSRLFATDPVVTAITPTEAVRGTRVTLEVARAPTDAPLWLWLKPRHPIPSAGIVARATEEGPFGPFLVEPPAKPTGDGKESKPACQLPGALPLGVYDAAVTAEPNTPPKT